MSFFLPSVTGVNCPLSSSDQRELRVDTWCAFWWLPCSWNLPWSLHLGGRYINVVLLLKWYKLQGSGKVTAQREGGWYNHPTVARRLQFTLSQFSFPGPPSPLQCSSDYKLLQHILFTFPSLWGQFCKYSWQMPGIFPLAVCLIWQMSKVSPLWYSCYIAVLPQTCNFEISGLSLRFIWNLKEGLNN